MSEHIYDNDSGESEQMGEIVLNAAGENDEAEERIVIIYDSADNLGGHNSSLNTGRAVNQSTPDQQPGWTSFRAVAMCLGLLCILLLAAIIGVGLHCRFTQQTHNTSWAERRKKTLVELSHFCRDGCKSFNNSFYYISSKTKNWEESRQDCKDRGADLVIINSKEEQAFISSYYYHWIGLNDREEEGTWKWVDGSVLNSTGFWRSEPSGQVKHCVSTSNRELSNWNAFYCTSSRNWICEKLDF
ncbi:CD209 antigen-like protein E [Thunnus thynnus]|uniref:CD209 antigen-like protein E n=1 Tax=Thunnus thynnus TaxID=8237 RepID=UPI003527771D